MEATWTMAHGGRAAPAAHACGEEPYGSSVAGPKTIGQPDSQGLRMYLSPRGAALWLALQTVEQCSTPPEAGQGSEEAISVAGFVIGYECPPGGEVEGNLDLYA